MFSMGTAMAEQLDLQNDIMHLVLNEVDRNILPIWKVSEVAKSSQI